MIKTFETEPIKAVKWAYLYIHNGAIKFDKLGPQNTVSFCGVGRAFLDHLYTPKDTTAKCHQQLRSGTSVFSHSDMPNENCTCGWYGLKKQHQHLPLTLYSPLNLGGVLLDVEFYGKIIEHPLGYRAQYQRIMRVSISTNVRMFAYGGRHSKDAITPVLASALLWSHEYVWPLVKNGFLANQLGTEVVLTND